MKFNPEIHHRRSIRLREYDYVQIGMYFVTICVQDRECLLGKITNRQIILNEYGNVVNEFWRNLSVHFSHIELDSFVIMPNHMHGIIVINNDCRGEVSSPLSGINKYKKGGETPPLRKRTLGQIIGYFKYQVTKQINIIRDTLGVPVWQRNYYERVIRNKHELERIREYIVYNPLKWDEDEYNPVNMP
jgi:putative transposase